MYQYKIIIYLLLLLSPPVLMSERAKIFCSDKQILGKVEKVFISDHRISLNAKMDTGADMSSLSASDIQFFEDNEKTWVKFKIGAFESQNVELIEPVIRFIKIRERGDEAVRTTIVTKRPVIVLVVTLGNQQKKVLCNLINRQHFQYPMLLGADALTQFHAMVDVSQQHLLN